MVTDEYLLHGLQTGDERAYQLLYKQHYPPIERFIIRNNGDCDQARDVFQETLMVILTNVNQPGFRLTASLKTYVFAIGKNLWLNQLKKSSRQTDLAFVAESDVAIDPAEVDPIRTATDVLHTILNELTARCRALLSALFFRDKTTAVIGQPYANKHSAQNQKYKCLQQARRIGQGRF